MQQLYIRVIYSTVNKLNNLAMSWTDDKQLSDHVSACGGVGDGGPGFMTFTQVWASHAEHTLHLRLLSTTRRECFQETEKGNSEPNPFE